MCLSALTLHFRSQKLELRRKKTSPHNIKQEAPAVNTAPNKLAEPTGVSPQLCGETSSHNKSSHALPDQMAPSKPAEPALQDTSPGLRAGTSSHNKSSQALPDKMAPSKPAEPSLLGIPPELRTIIYKYAATQNEKRTVLGRKLIKKPPIDDDNSNKLRGRFFSAVVEHPLSRVCRQICAEFLPKFQTLFGQSPGMSYNLIVNNFDLEQMLVFTTCKEMLGLTTIPMTLCCQMDRNILTSAEALRQCLSVANCRSECERLPIPEDWDFLVLLNYRDHSTGEVNKSKTMTAEQANKADAVFVNLRAGLNLVEDWKLVRLLGRFKKLLTCRHGSGWPTKDTTFAHGLRGAA